MPLASRLAETALLAVLLASAACDLGAPPPTHSPSSPPNIASYVTGPAAAALGPDGRFVLGEPPPRDPPVISRERASVLALAYVRTYGPYMEELWKEERGDDVRVDSLKVSPPVYYADSPYGNFPEGPFHPAFRRMFGPFYVVTMSDGHTPVMLVAVSAYNTDSWIDEHGEVWAPPFDGMTFKSAPLRASAQMGPERAVERIGRRTGARATQPPQLLLREWRQHPASPVWRVALDRGVRVRLAASGRRATVHELYVDRAGRFLIPGADQPEEEVHRLPVGPPWEPEFRRTMEARVPIVRGRATRYEEVEVERGS